MSPAVRWLAVALAAGSVGCLDNTAPGNDREAALDPPPRAAATAGAGAAIAGVAPGLLRPQIMTDADVGSLPPSAVRCTFRMTEVGYPVFLYGAEGVLKLNDSMVSLPRTGDGRYVADGVEATVRPLGEAGGAGERFEAELVILLPGSSLERGFHGFTTC